MCQDGEDQAALERSTSIPPAVRSERSAGGGITIESDTLSPLGVMRAGIDSDTPKDMASMDVRVDPICGLTSGDIARLLGVDLKTVHNWVKNSHLHGRRTKGRHLRFHRTEVVRFMRRFGYPVPRTIGGAAPRVVLAGKQSKGRSANGKPNGHARVRQLGVQRYDSLFDAMLTVGAGDYDVLAIELERYPIGMVVELIESLRRRSSTCGLGLLGIARRAQVRRVFIERGGDLAIDNVQDLRTAVRWLTGAGPAPKRATVPDPVS